MSMALGSLLPNWGGNGSNAKEATWVQLVRIRAFPTSGAINPASRQSDVIFQMGVGRNPTLEVPSPCSSELPSAVCNQELIVCVGSLAMLMMVVVMIMTIVILILINPLSQSFSKITRFIYYNTCIICMLLSLSLHDMRIYVLCIQQYTWTAVRFAASLGHPTRGKPITLVLPSSGPRVGLRPTVWMAGCGNKRWNLLGTERSWRWFKKVMNQLRF